MKLARSLSFLLAMMLTLPAYASIFPDVPDEHRYKVEIEKLVGAQVIAGNPDGTFQPEEPVNRAAMLKMLYKAAGITPDPSRVSCFKDVVKGSWYEIYVCDAAFRRFVQGYNDGLFRPEKPVSRSEGMKMALVILGIEVPEITTLNREVLSFVDFSGSAWYSKYFSVAFNKRLLPLAGWTGARLYPDWPLLRGEAAAYIQNTLDLKIEEDRAKVEEQSQSSSSAAAASEGFTASTDGADSSAAGKPPAPEDRSIEIAFPFTDGQTFQEKASVSYEFNLSAPKLVSVDVSLAASAAGKISCRLYKLESTGFSNEYYLGYEENQRCHLLVKLDKGSYQLQVQPTTPNTAYTVDAKESVAGDGNDGFMETKGLERNKLRTEVLSPNDYEDWYKFTVTRETEMTLSVVSTKSQRCLIYPGSNIDLFGFSGPACGQSYLYPIGTYIVGIGHVSPRAEKQTYTIQLK